MVDEVSVTVKLEPPLCKGRGTIYGGRVVKAGLEPMLCVENKAFTTLPSYSVNLVCHLPLHRGGFMFTIARRTVWVAKRQISLLQWVAKRRVN